MDERPVPARFKLARHQPVCGVSGIEELLLTVSSPWQLLALRCFAPVCSLSHLSNLQP